MVYSPVQYYKGQVRLDYIKWDFAFILFDIHTTPYHMLLLDSIIIPNYCLWNTSQNIKSTMKNLSEQSVTSLNLNLRQSAAIH
jgi:hypothetical protein